MVTRPRNLQQADPYFDSVVLLAPFSGEDADTTASDLSNSGHVLTFNGNAQLDGDIRKFGFTSALFDGTGDGITAPDSTDFDLGSGQFTVEADVRFNGDPGTTAMAIVGHYTPTGDERAWSMNLGNTASNQFRFSWSTNGAVGGYAEETAAWDPVGDQWYHLAVARDDTNLYMFIDGVLIKTVANSATFHSATAPLSIGMWSDGNQPLDGWIENVRITKGVCRYTATFTPPERAYPTTKTINAYEPMIVGDAPLVYFRMGEDDPGSDGNPIGDAVETMGFDTAAIWAENAANTVQFENASILPSGEGRSVSWTGSSWGGLFANVTDSSSYTPAGSFTIEGWVKVNGTITSNCPILGKETVGTFAEWKLTIRSDRTLRFRMGSQASSTNSSDTDTSLALTVGEVYHCVAVFRTTDNIPRIFVNGVEEATGSTWAFTVYDGSAQVCSGVIQNGGNSYRGNVNMQEVAFYDYALTDAQIRSHYQNGGGFI